MLGKEMAFQGGLPAKSAIIIQLALAVAWGVITFLALKKTSSEINQPGR
jgi:hypothetical protein